MTTRTVQSRLDFYWAPLTACRIAKSQEVFILLRLLNFVAVLVALALIGFALYFLFILGV